MDEYAETWQVYLYKNGKPRIFLNTEVDQAMEDGWQDHPGEPITVDGYDPTTKTFTLQEPDPESDKIIQDHPDISEYVPGRDPVDPSKPPPDARAAREAQEPPQAREARAVPRFETPRGVPDNIVDTDDRDPMTPDLE